MDTLFHYTSEEAARSIIEDEADFGLYFQVGVGNWHGHGLYATDITPVDRESMDDVSTRCFGGGATLPELDHVLVLLPHNAEHRFVRTGNPDEWTIFVPQALEIIRLETPAVGDPSLRRRRLDEDLGQRGLLLVTNG